MNEKRSSETNRTVLDRGSSYIDTRTFDTKMSLQTIRESTMIFIVDSLITKYTSVLISSDKFILSSWDVYRRWCQEFDYWYESKSRTFNSSVTYYPHYWSRHQSIRNRYSLQCSSFLEISFWYSRSSFSSFMIRFETLLYVYLMIIVSVSNDAYE